MEKLKQYRYYGLACLVIVVMIILFFLLKPKKEPELLFSSNSELEMTSSQAEMIYVDVKGEVNTPGVYECAKEERVQDAIKKAGGFTSEANQTAINLAQKLTDEMKIVVPNKQETQQDVTSTTSQKINLNTATKEELTTLTGIGQKKAEQIIQYRTEKGIFKTIEEITQVRGIGTKLYEQIKETITVN